MFVSLVSIQYQNINLKKLVKLVSFSKGNFGKETFPASLRYESGITKRIMCSSFNENYAGHEIDSDFAIQFLFGLLLLICFILIFK